MLRGVRSSRVAALCAVAALLLFAVVAARGETAVPGGLQNVPLERGTGDRPPGGGVGLEEGSSKLNIVDELQLVQTSFVIAAMILLLIAFAALIRRLQRMRRQPLRLGVGVGEAEEEVGVLEPTMRARLRRAAQRARDKLANRPGGLLGDAVVAAWLRLEEAAAHEGAGRAPHQTATEFTTALLSRYAADEAALTQLRELYQRARFGPPGQVTDADADAAIDALDRILHALANAATPAVTDA
jgi:Domain of unknown function (DUF4129)